MVTLPLFNHCTVWKAHYVVIQFVVQCIDALEQKDAVPLASMTARSPVREFAGSRHLDTS